MRFSNYFFLAFLFIYVNANSQIIKTDWENNFPDGCTSITVGKNASADGSVMTSHTDDSHRTRSWMDIAPAKKHDKNSKMPMYKRVKVDTFAMPIYGHEKIGEIPQKENTFGYINTAYPCMNEKQLAIGESTFGGREELQSDAGLIDCQRLVQIMLERTSTAREAIKLAGELTAKYGWRDAGECLTIADKKEVWHFEIVGPGKNKVGAVWVAQRVPDNHISVNANASTIKQIDISNSDFFMASKNIFEIAIENNWWNEKRDGEFQFCYAYAPEGRTSFAARRREWRVFDLVAPSLKLDPNAENYPFSVKPDKQVSLEKMVELFQDYYENTPFNFVKNITVTNDSGKTVLSPLANPFMPYDMNKVFKINGGWDWRGERTIARWYTMYGTITQSRDWLPDYIGGCVWLAQDNIASSIYIPVYCSVTDLPESYKTPGRVTGMSRKSAWWAFNYLGTTAAQRWGDMRQDVDAVWGPWQKELFENQEKIEKQAQDITNSKKRKKFLTDYTNKWGIKVVDKAWSLGDFLWTKYDEKF
ncbi:MAG: peptidase C69 [Bacteroidetes bacterium]|jgi:dipeptidase|nr:peptidase C69 [Bacteroidota bacterium]MBT6684785.1 peptidase C69 [Bacteroidota bacterium]MBT7141761.1 peptidase C69 [Bacteroidota bacterium]MBT7490729.1 peptidase C69 [Bacteroidota bacterium]